MITILIEIFISLSDATVLVGVSVGVSTFVIFIVIVAIAVALLLILLDWLIVYGRRRGNFSILIVNIAETVFLFQSPREKQQGTLPGMTKLAANNSPAHKGAT